jgi:hypothetical protein
MANEPLQIDYQNVMDACSHCEEDYVVTRGSVYRDGQGISIYLAALHQCKAGRAAHLAVAVQSGREGFDETCAVALQARASEDQIVFSPVDWELSPWKDEGYLGRLLSRDEALESDKKSTFFHIADHVVLKNPTIQDYLSE